MVVPPITQEESKEMDCYSNDDRDVQATAVKSTMIVHKDATSCPDGMSDSP